MNGLVQRLSRSPETRAKFVASHLDKFIAFQIRALRDRETMSQAELANALGTSQPTVNRWESSNRTRPTMTTLKRIAAVFDVGLEVRFVPFSKLVKFVSGTPYTEGGMKTESFYVPSFQHDDISELENNGSSNDLNGQRKGPQKSQEFGESDRALNNEIAGQNAALGGL
jgi:transcriptional regulator with XRE-family HTH domain